MQTFSFLLRKIVSSPSKPTIFETPGSPPLIDQRITRTVVKKATCLRVKGAALAELHHRSIKFKNSEEDTEACQLWWYY